LHYSEFRQFAPDGAGPAASGAVLDGISLRAAAAAPYELACEGQMQEYERCSGVSERINLDAHQSENP
jgi:hypothetical protein